MDLTHLTLEQILWRVDAQQQRAALPEEAADALEEIRRCRREVERRQAAGVWVR